jgi:antitoxin YefM
MDAAPLTEVRDRLSEIVERVASSADVFTITKHGRPMAVVLGHDEYESLIETLNVLADSDVMEAIAEAKAEGAGLDVRTGPRNAEVV